MKRATVRELRNNYSKVLYWVSLGEEVEVTRRGMVVAKVVPPGPATPITVDWKKSAALNRSPWSKTLSAAESAAILSESQGN
jgi:prevent-host-death family protein